MGGAFQTSRDIFTNPIWQDIPKFRIFFFIVGNAVFSQEGVRIANLHIKRGQFLRSYRNLSDDLSYIENRKVKKYSVSVISRKIEQLVQENRLKVQESELGTLFTVVNYELYQGFDHYKKKELGTELEHCWNSDGTELEQSWNNNNKDNKVKKEKKDKEKISIPFLEIVSYLNEKTNSKFKPTSKKTQELIKARWNESFTLEDFKSVIDKKTTEWLNDTKMSQYLRPETLFGTKFESYLNQKGGKIVEKSQRDYEGYDFDREREPAF
jgi:uncharacterized phage protein (TIGR02220 family)